MRLSIPTAFLALISLPGMALGQSGGIEIFSGETLFGQGTRLSLSYLHDRGNQLNSKRQRDRYVLGYNYGWSRRFTVGALLPFVDASAETGSPSSRMHRSNSGFGDATVFGKWRLYTVDEPQISRNISLVAGMEMPTGESGLSSPQPGSSSWDPFAAFAFTQSVSRWRFDQLVLFKWNTEGSGGVHEGDEWNLSASVAYRYLHRPYPGASNSARLGLVWQSQDRSTLGGQDLANTGSQRLYLRPALGFHPNPAIDLGISFDIPLDLRYSGNQDSDEFRATLAWGFRF
jgi:hypothetical protein